MRLLTEEEHAVRAEYMRKNKTKECIAHLGKKFAEEVRESMASRPEAIGPMSEEDCISLQEASIISGAVDMIIFMVPLYLKDDKNTEAFLNYLYDLKVGTEEIAKRLPSGRFSYDEEGGVQ